MLDAYLVGHCAPTLAGIKTANLFTCTVAGDLHGALAAWNEALREKGVRLLALRVRAQTALIYVYRRARLAEDLQKPGVASLLRDFGYTDLSPEGALHTLSLRLCAQAEFPNEIGVFLGYPLGDVRGFIENGGRNFKCCGCWKVYCDACDAERKFAQYKKCRQVYIAQWKRGRSVRQLTVAA